VAALAINANGDPVRFAEWKRPVLADPVEGFAGPLAGLLAGLDWAAALSPPVHWLATVPGDAPFLPVDLVERLMAAVADERTDMACASSGGRRHHVIALWPVAMREPLRRALVEEGIRKVEHWIDRHRAVVVDFSDAPRDPFFNVNSRDDLQAAERMLAARPTGG
jgi:molybdopterin-guanine dinucleotide biosynthesis protein A